MKTSLLLLAAAGMLGVAAAAPGEAQAGQVRVNIDIGVPAVVYRPRVVYQPVVAYRARSICPPPVIYYRPHAHYRSDREWHREYAPAYQGYEHSRDSAEIRVNPRLWR